MQTVITLHSFTLVVGSKFRYKARTINMGPPQFQQSGKFKMINFLWFIKRFTVRGSDRVSISDLLFTLRMRLRRILICLNLGLSEVALRSPRDNRNVFFDSVPREEFNQKRTCILVDSDLTSQNSNSGSGRKDRFFCSTKGG